MLIEQMIDFVEELPMEWQQKWKYIQQKCELDQGPVISMLLFLKMHTCLFHILDKPRSWKSIIPLFASPCQLYILTLLSLSKGTPSPYPQNFNADSTKESKKRF